VVYKSMLEDNLLPGEEHALYIQTIHVSIGFFLAPCKRPSISGCLQRIVEVQRELFPLLKLLGLRLNGRTA